MAAECVLCWCERCTCSVPWNWMRLTQQSLKAARLPIGSSGEPRCSADNCECIKKPKVRLIEAGGGAGLGWGGVRGVGRAGVAGTEHDQSLGEFRTRRWRGQLCDDSCPPTMMTHGGPPPFPSLSIRSSSPSLQHALLYPHGDFSSHFSFSFFCELQGDKGTRRKCYTTKAEIAHARTWGSFRASTLKS